MIVGSSTQLLLSLNTIVAVFFLLLLVIVMSSKYNSNWRHCTTCNRKFISIKALTVHKRYCKPGSSRFLLQTVPLSDPIYAHHHRPLPNDSSDALRILPQPDDYGRIFDIGSIGEDTEYWHNTEQNDVVVENVIDYALLQDAKAWRRDMDRKFSCHKIVYGQGAPTYYWHVKQKAIFALKDKAVCRDEAEGSPPKKGPLNLGWIKDPLSGKTFPNNWHTVMDLYGMMRDHQLSRLEGNEILNTFRRIAERSDATLIMPTTVDSVILAVEKSSCGDSNKGVIEVTIPLSNIFFNGQYVDFGAAKAVGCMVNPMQLIMEWFCETSIDDYDVRPVELMLSDPQSPNSGPQRYFAGHASCDDFKAFCEAGVRDFGESFLPISVQLQLDATVYQTGGSKTLTPFYIRIANFKERLFHLHKKSIKITAFMPVILSTAAELDNMLTLNGFLNKTDRGNIMRYVNRYIHQKFLEVIIAEFQKYSIDGAYLSFGNSSDRDLLYVVVPLLMNLPNDNQERYQLLGLKHGQHGIRNCASCSLNSKFFYKLGTLGRRKPDDQEVLHLRRMIDAEPLRDATVHEYLCEKGEYVWMKDITGKAQKALKLPVAHDLIVTQSERAFNGRQGPVYAYNCQYQKCLLYNVMDYQIRNSIVTPITVSWYEVLHSVFKGIVELDFRFIMASIHLAVKNKITGVNPDAIGIIDQRVKDFQVNQAYALFGTKSVILNKGLSPCFKDTKTTSDALSKAVMTGGNVDANRLPYYLFYLMMSIGSLGDCLPNHSIRLQIPPDGEWVIINPTKVAIEAASSALEEVSILKGDMFSESHLSRLRYCCHLANSKLKSLFLMKQGLGGFYTGTGEFHHIKPHGSTHSDQAIRGTGEPRAWDASPFESEHTAIKKSAPLTSRRSGTVQIEMLKYSRNVDLASSIESSRRLSFDPTTDNDSSQQEATDNESLSEYIDEQDFSGSLTNSEQDRPSKCTIYITDSRTLSWSMKRPKECARSSVSATISESLQNVILNAVMKGIEASHQHVISTSSSSSSASTTLKNDNSYIPFLHPFIKIPYLMEALTIYGVTNAFVNCFLQRLKSGDSSVSLELLSHFSVVPCGVKNHSPELSDEFREGGCKESEVFRLYSTNEYVFQRGFSKKLDKLFRRYDCATFQYNDSQDRVVIQPGRILGIVRLVDTNASSSMSSDSKKRPVSAVTSDSSNYRRRSTTSIFDKVNSTTTPTRTKTTAIHRRETDRTTSSIKSYKDEEDKILLLICWMSEENKGTQRNCFPYPYYKYDTILHGNQRVLYTQIVHPSSLLLPLYTIHDIDTRPDYEYEGSTMSAMMNDRFWSFPFELFRKLRRQYFGCFPSDFLFCDTVDLHNNEDQTVVDSNDVAAVVVELAVQPADCHDDESYDGEESDHDDSVDEESDHDD